MGMEPRETLTNLTDRTYIPSDKGRPWPRPIKTSYIPQSDIPFEPVPDNYTEANQTGLPCTADDVTHAPIIPSCTFTNGNVKCNEGATLAWTVFTVLLLLIAICININSIRGALASRLATVQAKKAEEYKSDRFPHKSTVWLLITICVCSMVLTCFVLVPQLYSLAIIISNDFVYDPFTNGTCLDQQTNWPSTTPPIVLLVIALVIHVSIFMILAMMCAIIVETYLKLLISNRFFPLTREYARSREGKLWPIMAAIVSFLMGIVPVLAILIQCDDCSEDMTWYDADHLRKFAIANGEDLQVRLRLKADQHAILFPINFGLPTFISIGVSVMTLYELRCITNRQSTFKINENQRKNILRLTYSG